MSTNPSSKSPASALADQLFGECNAMVRYALSKGVNVPPKVTEIVETATKANETGHLSACVPALNYAHTTLSSMLSPALPGAIYMLEQEADKRSWAKFLGALPIMRKMVVVSLISLIAMVVIGLSPMVNDKVLAKGVLDDSGLELLVNLAYLLFAASVGAGFSILFKLRKEIKEATFLSLSEGLSWTRWVMGIVAGFIISEVIPADFLGDWMGTSAEQSKLMLALLGGFSAPVVYTILNLLVESVATALKGGEARSIEQATNSMRSQMAHQSRSQELDLASGLNRLSQEVASGADATTINEKIKALLEGLVSTGGEVSLPELPEGKPAPAPVEENSESPTEEAPATPEDAPANPAPGADAPKDQEVPPSADPTPPKS